MPENLWGNRGRIPHPPMGGIKPFVCIENRMLNTIMQDWNNRIRFLNFKKIRKSDIIQLYSTGDKSRASANEYTCYLPKS